MALVIRTDFEYVVSSVEGCVLRFRVGEAGGTYGLARTGQVLWNGSILLADILQAKPPIPIAGSSILELGAGCCGIPGQVASVLGATNVTFTDISDELTGLEGNIALNTGYHKGDINVAELDWSWVREHRCLPVAFQNSRFHLIICSDLVYGNTFQDLAVCLLLLLKQNADAVVLMSNAMRKHVHIFRRRLQQYCEFIDWVPGGMADTHDAVWLIQLRKEARLDSLFMTFCPVMDEGGVRSE